MELAQNKIRDQFLNDLGDGYLRMNIIRGGILDTRIQTLSQEHESCALITDSPSIRPSEVTPNPSMNIPETSSSLLFQIALKSNKNAEELALCCRNQILISVREILRKTINDIASKPIQNRNLNFEEKTISHHSLRSSKGINLLKKQRHLQDDRSDEGPQLYAVILLDISDQEGKKELKNKLYELKKKTN